MTLAAIAAGRDTPTRSRNGGNWRSERIAGITGGPADNVGGAAMNAGLTEFEATLLPGFGNSAPVRIGQRGATGCRSTCSVR